MDDNKNLTQNYSYDEIAIGTWVNGSILYRKCYNWNNPSNPTMPNEMLIGFAQAEWEQMIIVNVKLIYQMTSGYPRYGWRYPMWYPGNTAADAIRIEVRWNTGALIANTGIVIVEYYKPSAI